MKTTNWEKAVKKALKPTGFSPKVKIDKNDKQKDVKIKRIYWKNDRKNEKKTQKRRKPLEDSPEKQIFEKDHQKNTEILAKK